MPRPSNNYYGGGDSYHRQQDGGYNRRKDYRDDDYESGRWSGGSYDRNNKGRYRQRSRSRSPYRDDKSSHYSGHRQDSYPQRVKNEPTDRVMLQNLSYMTTQGDIEDALYFMKVEYVSVDIIHDHDTGISRGFGFIHFPSVDIATTFVDKNFPGFELDNRMVYVNFCKNKPPHEVATDWACQQCTFTNFKKRDKCFQCGFSRPKEEPFKLNTGERDMSEIPSKTIVIRNLDTLTTEEKIFEVFQKLAPVLSVKLMKDAVTQGSLGFAFVDFRDVPTAAFVVQTVATDTSFIIDQRHVKAHYAAPTSFIEEENGTLTYWDKNVFAAKYSPPAPPVGNYNVTIPSVLQQQKQQNQSQKMEADLDAFFAEVSDLVAPPDPTAAGPLPTPPSASQTIGPVAPPTALPTAIQIQLPHSAPSRVDVKKKVIVDKKTKEQIDRWKVKQEEVLSASEQEEDAEEEELPFAIPTDDEFADYKISACLLCQRRFKNNDDLKRHQALSDLHKTNMKTHVEKLFAEHGMKPRPLNTKPNNGGVRSRQKLYRGPKPKRQKTKEKDSDKFMSVEEATKLYESQQSSDKKEGDNLPETLKKGVGNKLLQKMGWKEGSGLGKEESGISSAINAETYTPGVGIGAGLAMTGEDKAALAMGDYKSRGRQLARMRFENE